MLISGLANNFISKQFLGPSWSWIFDILNNSEDIEILYLILFLKSVISKGAENKSHSNILKFVVSIQQNEKTSYALYEVSVFREVVSY